MRRKQRLFKVRVDLPEDVTPGAMADYIGEAVAYWAKQYNPGTYECEFRDRDPLFDIDKHNISVEYAGES